MVNPGEARWTGLEITEVVDGRTMSWEALGLALEPYEGWGFRLVIEDRVRDVRSDAGTKLRRYVLGQEKRGNQEAAEAANFNSYQMQAAFGNHEIKPGAITLQSEIPSWVRKELRNKGYLMDFRERTSGPINAIWFDWEHGSFWGGSSNHGEDYGIGW